MTDNSTESPPTTSLSIHITTAHPEAANVIDSTISCLPELPAPQSIPHKAQRVWQAPWQPKSRHNRRQNPTTSRNQQQIDQQIWLLHQAIVEKILKEPAHASRLLQQLDNRYQQGQLRHAEYLFWSSSLLQIDQPDLFRQTLLSSQPQAVKYRRRTALSGVLTEDERQAVLFKGVTDNNQTPP